MLITHLYLAPENDTNLGTKLRHVTPTPQVTDQIYVYRTYFEVSTWSRQGNDNYNDRFPRICFRSPGSIWFLILNVRLLWSIFYLNF